MVDMVEKGTFFKGVAAVGLVCEVDPKRYMSNIKWALPLADLEKSPIGQWKKDNPDAVLSLEAAVKETRLVLQQLRLKKRAGDKEGFRREAKIEFEEEEEEEDDEEEEDIDDLTPPYPVLSMNLDEVSKYFALLMRRLQEMQYGQKKDKKFLLWASRKNPAAEPGNEYNILLY